MFRYGWQLPFRCCFGPDFSPEANPVATPRYPFETLEYEAPVPRVQHLDGAVGNEIEGPFSVGLAFFAVALGAEQRGFRVRRFLFIRNGGVVYLHGRLDCEVLLRQVVSRSPSKGGRTSVHPLAVWIPAKVSETTRAKANISTAKSICG
jgi:hypothetical protein